MRLGIGHIIGLVRVMRGEVMGFGDNLGVFRIHG